MVPALLDEVEQDLAHERGRLGGLFGGGILKGLGGAEHQDLPEAVISTVAV